MDQETSPVERFFGYGSLVNTATHGYADIRPDTVPGWRRVWVQNSRRPVAFLSVHPAPGARIEGLTASVRGVGWEELDRREAAYDRLTLPDPHGRVAIYRASPAFVAPSDLGQAILLSYLDVVVQGFLRVYGEPGVARFFDTTDGWTTPVRDDRADPVYPRAQVLTPQEAALVDHHLGRLSVRLVGGHKS
ncbi:MAG: gamma-glutamylcyclotransferase family protein [Pseudomonadota bacterium]